MLFGPAYKGIPIATTTAVALKAHHGINVGVAFNRKEAKWHGEGGSLIGHGLEGRVVVVDDVMSAGTAFREAAELVSAAGAELGGALVALDRREPSRPGGVETAVAEVSERYGVPVRAIVSLEDVTGYLDLNPVHADALRAIHAYQSDNCITNLMKLQTIFAYLIAVTAVPAMAADLIRFRNEDGILVLAHTIPTHLVHNGYTRLTDTGRVIEVIPSERGAIADGHGGRASRQGAGSARRRETRG